MQENVKTKRPSILSKNQSGQVLVIGLFVVIGLAMIAITVANVGMMVAEKIKVQDSVDAAAYSAAVAQARYMNLSAYVNRAIIANYNAMAFNTSLWAVFAAWDHGLVLVAAILYLLAGVLQFIPIINALAPAVDQAGAGVDAVHNGFHAVHAQFDDLFAQDEDKTDLNKYIEIFNTDILSMYQGIMYVAMQSSRYNIIQNVAEKNDPNVITTTVLGLGAEALNADELAHSVDFLVETEDEDKRDAPFRQLNEIFNDITEPSDIPDDDKPVMLGALAEASLDKFTAGRFRDENRTDLLRNLNLGNILAEIIGSFAKEAIDLYYEAECAAGCVLGGFLTGDCDCGRNSSLVIGSQQVWGFEDEPNSSRVPIIARQRMREVNEWTISFGDMPGGLTTFINIARELLSDEGGGGGGGSNFGYSSAERHADIRNFTNLFDGERTFDCIITGCQMNELNAMFGLLTGSLAGAGEKFFDDHWDGTFDAKPAKALRLYSFQNVASFGEVFDYISELSTGEGPEMGVPKYDWRVDLPYVAIPTYHYQGLAPENRTIGNTRYSIAEDGTDDHHTFEGPSIAVVGTKHKEHINGLVGLGINNEHSITAMARAQVYYLRNPNRPEEKPSLFNPHWVARLAPIDNDATPPLLRDGLSFVGSMGIPLSPTH